MLSLFITVAAWLALIGSLFGIVQVMLKPKPDQSQQDVAAQVIAAVVVILLAVGMLARADLSLYLPLALLGFVLAMLAVVLRIRKRSA